MSAGGFSSLSLSEAGPPSDADYVSLAARWIDRDLANAAGIRRVRPTVTDYQGTIDGVLAWCYVGIAMVASHEA